ncbi:MAG: PQQ-binding-like beta-propeller repeat protein [Clostridia bacterium]|nr:PQQ-binding-like beta-propeller repeat protein [Clostridia bacterium]
MERGIYIEPVVNCEGWVYAVAGNMLYAFDEEGGELFSPISLTEEVYARNVYSLGLSTDEKTLYVGLATNDGAAVAAFNAQLGSLKWFFNEIAGEAVESFNVDDNVIYFGTKGRASGEWGKFYALKDEGSHASLLWDNELFKEWKEISFPHPCPIHGDTLFITAVGDNREAGMLAVNKNNGTSLWDSAIAGLLVFRGPVVVDENGNYLYWVSDMYLIIYRTSNGSSVNFYNFRDPNETERVTPAAVDNGRGRVFVLAYNYLHCLDLEGEFLFKTKPEDPSFTIYPFSGPVVDGRGHVYFGDNNGSIYAVDEKGNFKWCFDTNHIITSSPVLGPDGSIVFGNRTGKLFVLGDRKLFDLKVIYPRDGSYVGGTVPFLIDVIGEGAQEVDKVRVFVDGFSNEAVKYKKGKYYWEWDASRAVTGKVYSVEVIGEDSWGIQKSLKLNLIADNAAPVGSAFYDGEYKESTVSLSVGETVRIYGSSLDKESGVKRIILFAQNLSNGSQTIVGCVYNDALEGPFNWEITWGEMEEGVYKLYCCVEDRTFSAERHLDISGERVVGNYAFMEVLSKEGKPLIFKWEEKGKEVDTPKEPENRKSGGSRGGKGRDSRDKQSIKKDPYETVVREIYIPFNDRGIMFLWTLNMLGKYFYGIGSLWGTGEVVVSNNAN